MVKLKHTSSHLNELVKFDKSSFSKPSQFPQLPIAKWNFYVFSPFKSFHFQEVLVLPKSNRFFLFNLFDTKIGCLWILNIIRLKSKFIEVNRKIFQVLRYELTPITYAWNDVILNSTKSDRHTFGFLEASPASNSHDEL